MASPSVGRTIDLDGVRLWHWVEEGDSDGMPVVFLPGGGGLGLDFLLTHLQVNQNRASLIYDRAGTGFSDDVTLPRTATEVVDELRRLLSRLGLTGPYLLVGHSLGGGYAQRLAQLHPDEVAGLVLLDPLHAQWNDFMPDEFQILPHSMSGYDTTSEPELPDGFMEAFHAMLDHAFADFPPAEREAIIERRTRPDRLYTGFREGINIHAIIEELNAAGPVPDLPTVIIGAHGSDPQQEAFSTTEQIKAQAVASERLYCSIADRLTFGRYTHVEDASHSNLPMLRPDTITDAILEIEEHRYR